MKETWVLDSHHILDNYDSSQNGENLNYQRNLELKLNNTITLPFVFKNKKNTYSNFSYNKDGTKLAIILKNDERTNFEFILYNPKEYAVEYEQKLNKIINKKNYSEFLFHDERNILYKLFGNLSFLRLSQDTNNIYFLTENHLLLTSLDRTIFIFIKLNENNEYDEDSNNKNTEEDNKSNNIIENDCLIVKSLTDIIYEIKNNYINMNIKLSSVDKKIDNLIDNTIPKNIYGIIIIFIWQKFFPFS